MICICVCSCADCACTIIVKSFGSKKLWRIRTGGSLVEKTFGNLKSICLGNVMEIVKIDEKTWQVVVIHQSFLPPMFFTVWYIIIYDHKVK